MRLPELPPLGQARNRIGPARLHKSPPPKNRLTELQDFGTNPGALRLFAHIPETLPKKAPLVVVLHGCGQTAAGYDHGAGWSALGDRLGFAVLAPEQQTANNMAGCFNWFQPGDVAREQGEAASIAQMIRHVLSKYRLDEKRVFITGLSAGGAMTGAMLAAYPEIFAGGAIIAGLAYGAASNVPEALHSMRRAPLHSAEEWGATVRKASSHAGPWPMLSVWHGDADATVHVSNAEAVIGQWSDLHDLMADASETRQGEGHVHRLWRDADGRPVLESYILAGLAHGTPVHAASEGGGNAGPFFLEAGLSSTLQIADFWGLKQRAPQVIVKDVLRRLKPAQPVVESGAEVPPASPPDVKPRNMPPKVESTPEKVDGLRGVIVKALKAAGLVK